MKWFVGVPLVPPADLKWLQTIRCSHKRIPHSHKRIPIFLNGHMTAVHLDPCMLQVDPRGEKPSEKERSRSRVLEVQSEVRDELTGEKPDNEVEARRVGWNMEGRRRACANYEAKNVEARDMHMVYRKGGGTLAGAVATDLYICPIHIPFTHTQNTNKGIIVVQCNGGGMSAEAVATDLYVCPIYKLVALHREVVSVSIGWEMFGT
ncbi:hypothetical protein E3N88_22572 [Mikania micrantha]|uniref:Uncharacterized protein n=1 Tax=Mikania micrantha TaxID=192012 RepID=A0A5N6NAU7_9ASTR|nr:hypothetical protein E3N88_22572 [Mikania micrantha]